MKKPSRAGVTLLEAARVLSRLERQTISAAQVRGILVLDTAGRAVTPRRRGETRVYSAEEVACARVVWRLRRQGVSPTVARVVVACLKDQMLEIWRDRRPMALAVTGITGLLLWRGARPEQAIGWVDLPDVWRGVEDAIVTVRRKQPDVWQWKPQPAAAMTGDMQR